MTVLIRLAKQNKVLHVSSWNVVGSVETAITVTMECLEVKALRRQEFPPFRGSGRDHAVVSRSPPPSGKSRAAGPKGSAEDSVSKFTAMEQGDSSEN